jgi:hypothetical protein
MNNPKCCGLPTYLMYDKKYFCLKCKKTLVPKSTSFEDLLKSFKNGDFKFDFK